MSQRKLEHAATSPSRFVKLLMTSDVPVRPFVTRQLNARTPDDQGGLNKCHIVPGGRFLITMSVNGGAIHIWDLGSTIGAMVKVFPLASIKPNNQAILAIHPTEDRAGIQLFVSSKYDIRIYDVYPLSSAPAFNMIASLKYLDEFYVFSAWRDLVVFQNETLVTVWNFVLNSTVTWDVSVEYSQALIFRNEIALFDCRGFTLWSIPPLQPHVGFEGFEPISSPQKPVWTFCYAGQDDFRRVTVGRNSWSPDPSRTMYFSVLATTYQSQSTIDYYMMKPLSNQPDDDIPSSIPVLMSSSVIDGTHGQVPERYCKEIWVSGNWLVQSWTTAKGVVVHITRAPTSRQETMPNMTFLLWSNPHVGLIAQAHANWQCSALCPISGRLCHAFYDACKSYEIQVMDYIIPM